MDDLKSDKKDDTGICTNHIINGTHKLHIVLTMLFNTMLRHGTAPDAFNTSRDNVTTCERQKGKTTGFKQL